MKFQLCFKALRSIVTANTSKSLTPKICCLALLNRMFNWYYTHKFDANLVAKQNDDVTEISLIQLRKITCFQIICTQNKDQRYSSNIQTIIRYPVLSKFFYLPTETHLKHYTLCTWYACVIIPNNALELLLRTKKFNKVF